EHADPPSSTAPAARRPGSSTAGASDAAPLALRLLGLRSRTGGLAGRLIGPRRLRGRLVLRLRGGLVLGLRGGLVLGLDLVGVLARVEDAGLAAQVRDDVLQGQPTAATALVALGGALQRRLQRRADRRAGRRRVRRGRAGVGAERRLLLDLGSRAVAGLDGLLQRQRDAAADVVDVDDLDGDDVTDLEHLLGTVDVGLGQLGDVDEALDALLELHEGTERHQLGDGALDELAHVVLAGELAPRVLLRPLERQADPLAVHLDVEDLDLDLLADLDDLAGVVDVLPRQLGHVHETVDAAEVDEGTEVDDGADGALAHLAGLQRL